MNLASAHYFTIFFFAAYTPSYN